jgi:hypothetical protein
MGHAQKLIRALTLANAAHHLYYERVHELNREEIMNNASRCEQAGIGLVEKTELVILERFAKLHLCDKELNESIAMCALQAKDVTGKDGGEDGADKKTGLDVSDDEKLGSDVEVVNVEAKDGACNESSVDTDALLPGELANASAPSLGGGRLNIKAPQMLQLENWSTHAGEIIFNVFGSNDYIMGLIQAGASTKDQVLQIASAFVSAFGVLPTQVKKSLTSEGRVNIDDLLVAYSSLLMLDNPWPDHYKALGDHKTVDGILDYQGDDDESVGCYFTGAVGESPYWSNLYKNWVGIRFVELAHMKDLNELKATLELQDSSIDSGVFDAAIRRGLDQYGTIAEMRKGARQILERTVVRAITFRHDTIYPKDSEGDFKETAAAALDFTTDTQFKDLESVYQLITQANEIFPMKAQVALSGITDSVKIVLETLDGTRRQITLKECVAAVFELVNVAGQPEEVAEGDVDFGAGTEATLAVEVVGFKSDFGIPLDAVLAKVNALREAVVKVRGMAVDWSEQVPNTRYIILAMKIVLLEGTCVGVSSPALHEAIRKCFKAMAEFLDRNVIENPTRWLEVLDVCENAQKKHVQYGWPGVSIEAAVKADKDREKMKGLIQAVERLKEVCVANDIKDTDLAARPHSTKHQLLDIIQLAEELEGGLIETRLVATGKELDEIKLGMNKGKSWKDDLCKKAEKINFSSKTFSPLPRKHS